MAVWHKPFYPKKRKEIYRLADLFPPWVKLKQNLYLSQFEDQQEIFFWGGGVYNRALAYNDIKAPYEIQSFKFLETFLYREL